MSAAIALVAFGMTACGGSTEEGEEAGPVTYTLDAEATSLKWEGVHVSDGHKHNGTIMISEGTVVYTGDVFTSGEFTVDMNTIKDEDLQAPMSDTLNKHLASPYFFNSSEYPATTVKINSVKDNEVNATINVMGKDMEAVIPVKIKQTDKKVTAKGKFTLDFSSYNMMGMTEDPKMPKMYTNPVVNFEIDMVLKAEETEKAAE